MEISLNHSTIFLQNREIRKSEIEKELPAEPEPNHPNSIRLLLRVPSGSRIERRFLKDQSLKVGKFTCFFLLMVLELVFQ